MRIGFYTAVLGDQPIEEVARWAGTAGFAALEVDVESHIGDPAEAARVIETVRQQGLKVCALTYFGNLLDTDRNSCQRARSAVQSAVDVAAACDVEMVITFPGRDETVSDDDNYHLLTEYYGSLAENAGRNSVKIAIENWPGPHQNYLATTPEGWARLFRAVPASNLGLNFDSSRQVTLVLAGGPIGCPDTASLIGVVLWSFSS